jgi:hypothetical protein
MRFLSLKLLKKKERRGYKATPVEKDKIEKIVKSSFQAQ